MVNQIWRSASSLLLQIRLTGRRNAPKPEASKVIKASDSASNHNERVILRGIRAVALL
jgi:hypothetical protein